MALRGLRPVVEIMFGDFLALAADQIVNHAAKFRWMYNDQVRVPLVIRTPMGGRRGYGPTHSQTLEKHFLGVPGLRVLAPCALGSPGRLLETAILETEDPLLFVENKLLYLQPVRSAQELDEFEISTISLAHRASAAGDTPGLPDPGDHGLGEAFTLTLRGAPPPVLTLAAYGHMAELARQALQRLAYEQEIFSELVVVTQLSPCEIDPILASAIHTGRILTLEEGSLTLGWGAEILARLATRLGPRLHAAGRLAAQDLPVPASGLLEAAVLPGIEEIIQAAQKTLR
jgi:pyruvate/2-oxoglutarate/acetoin dehydrogenase E1 component